MTTIEINDAPEDIVQLSEEEVKEIQNELKQETKSTADDKAEELGLHPEAKQKFELIKTYKGKIVNFHLMTIKPNNSVVSTLETPVLEDYDEEKDTITFTKMYLAPAETSTPLGVTYYGKVVIEHASWMDIQEGNNTKHTYDCPVGTKTLIIKE